MKSIVIIHGRPSREEFFNPEIASCSNNHWIPWLQKQLLVRGIIAHTPEIPRAWDPHYETWSTELRRYEIGPDTSLVGHSFGAGFLVRWLTENSSARIDKLILVAPSLGIGTDKADFFDVAIERRLSERTTEVRILISDNDRPGILEAAKKLVHDIRGAEVRIFPGYGHFTEKDLGTHRFPELLEELVPH